jgi:hypothetical protein
MQPDLYQLISAMYLILSARFLIDFMLLTSKRMEEDNHFQELLQLLQVLNLPHIYMVLSLPLLQDILRAWLSI